jgi:NAD(P)-dependent dehydrogenase (short-subunit alcohol dehydrogenase family)
MARIFITGVADGLGQMAARLMVADRRGASASLARLRLAEFAHPTICFR